MNRGLLIRELPSSERPRERLALEGPDNLKNSELIAILLRTGTKGVSAIAIGEELMAKYATLDNLSRVTVDELCQVKDIGRGKAVTLVATFALARQMAKEIQREEAT